MNMRGIPSRAYMMVTTFPNEVRVVRFPYPMVVKMVREYIRELLKVQTLTPGSFPVYPLLTFLTTFSWNLNSL